MVREGGWETSFEGGTLSKLKIYVQACTAETQGVYPVQAARRLTALLLHVWIEWYIMVRLYRVGCGCEPGRCRLEVEYEQILTRRRSPLAYPTLRLVHYLA